MVEWPTDESYFTENIDKHNKLKLKRIEWTHDIYWTYTLRLIFKNQQSVTFGAQPDEDIDMYSVDIPEGKPIRTINLWYGNNDNIQINGNVYDIDHSTPNLNYMKGLEFLGDGGDEDVIVEIGIQEGTQRTFSLPKNTAIVGAKTVEHQDRETEGVRRLEFKYM